MTPARLYLIGLVVVAVVALGVAFALPAAQGRAVALALGAAMVVQAPLGWRLISAIGSPRFLKVWVLGMGARIGLLALAAVAARPLLGWPVGPLLLGLAAVLLALLAVEVFVAVTAGRSKVEVR